MKDEMGGTRMLIVEDDPEMGMGLQDYFDILGYDVTRAADGNKALQLMTTLPAYDVVLLDVMLPNKNGFEILREARKAGVNSPVVMLTVKGTESDKLQGFDLGADDYVTKPFSAEELSARVKAVLKRTQAPSETPMEIYRFGELEVKALVATLLQHVHLELQPGQDFAARTVPTISPRNGVHVTVRERVHLDRLPLVPAAG